MLHSIVQMLNDENNNKDNFCISFTETDQYDAYIAFQLKIITGDWVNCLTGWESIATWGVDIHHILSVN